MLIRFADVACIHQLKEVVLHYDLIIGTMKTKIRLMARAVLPEEILTTETECFLPGKATMLNVQKLLKSLPEEAEKKQTLSFAYLETKRPGPLGRLFRFFRKKEPEVKTLVRAVIPVEDCEEGLRLEFTSDRKIPESRFKEPLKLEFVFLKFSAVKDAEETSSS